MSGPPPRVLLLGAGHAHAVVLERWAEARPAALQATVVTDRASLAYSGMIPGVVAREYALEETFIDAAHLCDRAGARLVVERIVGLDPATRTVRLEGGRSLDYDVASLDLGSTVKGRDEPEVRSRTVSARDPRGLLDALAELDAARDAAGHEGETATGASAVVVGGGAAGVELAATLLGRPDVGSVTLVEAADRLLDGYAQRVGRRVEDALTRRGVVVHLGDTVERVGRETVVLASGRHLTSRLTVWATGAAPPPVMAALGLPLDRRGFVAVDDHLRVLGHDELFAAGDCAGMHGRDVPKAGVHAVRQGPVLFENLLRTARAAESGAHPRPTSVSLEAYEPQSDFLTLLNLGDGTALGTKWGWTVEGRWVRWLKDRIDRRFVARFRA